MSTTSAGERKSICSFHSFHLFQASRSPFQSDHAQCRSQHRHHRRLPTNPAASLPPCPRQNHVNNRPFLRREREIPVRTKTQRRQSCAASSTKPSYGRPSLSSSECPASRFCTSNVQHILRGGGQGYRTAETFQRSP